VKNHTTARKGKRVNIILKDGTTFVDKLVEKKSTYYEFEREGRIPIDKIRSFSINKNGNPNHKAHTK